MDYWTIETIPMEEKKVDEKGMPIGRGVNGGIYRSESPNDRTRNYVSVESVDEYIEKVKPLGGKIVVPKQEIPDIGWTAIARDPEGNYFGIFQAK